MTDAKENRTKPCPAIKSLAGCWRDCVLCNGSGRVPVVAKKESPPAPSPWTRIDYDNPATLPARNRRVLFVRTWPFKQVLSGFWEPSIKAWCEDTHDDAELSERVTHWMPLPALPEDK